MRAASKKKSFRMKWTGLKPVAPAERNSMSANVRWRGKQAVSPHKAAPIDCLFLWPTQGEDLGTPPHSRGPFPREMGNKPTGNVPDFPGRPPEKTTRCIASFTLSDPKRECYTVRAGILQHLSP